jgi:hypothetical protein
MRKTLVLATLLLVLTAAAGRAQKLTDQPGYVPVEQLDLFPRDKLSVEINIEGALMSLIAAGARSEDPEFASVIAGLKAITVRAVPLKDVDADSVRGRISRTIRWLEDRDWKSMVRVRDQGEEVYIYLKETGGKIAGLTVLTFDPGEEAVVINIVGRIDPEQLGRLSQRLDIDYLDKIPAGKKSEKKSDKKPE